MKGENPKHFNVVYSGNTKINLIIQIQDVAGFKKGVVNVQINNVVLEVIEENSVKVVEKVKIHENL